LFMRNKNEKDEKNFMSHTREEKKEYRTQYLH